MYPPSPYSQPSYAPPPPPLRPARGLGLFAVIGLVITSVVSILAAVIDLWYAGVIDEMIADIDSVPEARINQAYLVYGLSGLLETAALILAIVAFLVWLFRVRSNAEILAPGQHRRSTPWLIFAWIIPIISFWFPKQIVDDIWTASRDRDQSGAGLIGFWWAAWVIGSLVENVAGRLLFNAEELDSIAAAARFDVVSIGLMLVAAVLAVFVVRQITEAQERRLTESSTGHAYHPAY
jgi:hypothetical protein